MSVGSADMRLNWLMAVGLACTSCTDADDAVGQTQGAATEGGDDEGDTAANADDSSSTRGDDAVDSSGDAAAETDTGASEVEPYRSGDRLRAVVERSSEGLERFSHFHDSELGVDCFPAQATDGEDRCLPRTYVTAAFSDADCTQPAAISHCEVLPQWVRSFVPSQCPELLDRGSVWLVGTPANTLYRRNADGECMTNPGWAGFHVVEADPEEFVAVDADIEDADGGVGYVTVSSSDGAHAQLGPVDTARGLWCQVNENVAEGRCVGFDTALARDDLHTDAGCGASDVAWHIYGAECMPPPAVRHDGGSLSRVGEALDPADLYQGSSDSACAPFESGLGGQYFAIEPWSGDGLPAAEVTTIGEGRLRARRVVTADGTAVAPVPATWYDSELDMPCSAQPSIDGPTVCAPTNSAAPPNFFADAACTVPLRRQDNPSPIWLAFTEPACPAWQVTGAGLLGDAHTGDVYAAYVDGCELQDDPEGLGSFHEYATLVGLEALAVIAQEQL